VRGSLGGTAADGDPRRILKTSRLTVRTVIFVMIVTDFGDLIAERMRVEHRTLATRWFDRLLDLLPVDARQIFPTESLLDHVPALIRDISAYLRQPDDVAVAANTAINAKACELGALRHQQRASLHQVLREYQLLSAVLVSFVLEEMERLDTPPPAADAVALVARINEAVAILSQATVEEFVGLYTQTIADQKERLEQYTRMAAHEWRQPLGALQFATQLVRRSDADSVRLERTWAAIDRNLEHLVALTRKLESIARMRDDDSPMVQEVSVAAVAQEAARQLREMADARGVAIVIADDLPVVTVDVGRLELVLVNLLSNAIKYSDPEKPSRHVTVRSAGGDQATIRIEIADNGVGIPEQARATIFHRFTRAHADRDDASHVTGIGLGLAITEDCVRAMDAQIEVRSVEHEGTVFTLTLPRTVAAE
jgi:signal transduction histidine kinase